MRSRFPRLAVLAALAAAAGLLGACGGGGGDEGGDDNDDPLALLEPVLVEELGSVAVSCRFPDAGPGCLTIVPNPWTDGVGDEIPDAADFVFDADGCAFDWGFATGTVHGVTSIADPGAVFGYHETLAAMTWVFTETSTSVTTTRVLDGTRVFGGSRQVLVMDEDLTIAVASSGGRVGVLTTDLTVTFTAAAGQEVHFGPGVLLPAGQFALVGSCRWVEGADTTLFDVTTPTPIAYEAGCSSPYPVQGVVWLWVTDGAERGHLVASWDGCGSDMLLEWEPEARGLAEPAGRR